MRLQYDIIEEKYGDFDYEQVVNDEDWSSEENSTMENLQEIVNYFGSNILNIKDLGNNERKLWSYMINCAIQVSKRRFFREIYDTCDQNKNICEYNIHDEDNPFFQDIIYVKLCNIEK